MKRRHRGRNPGEEPVERYRTYNVALRVGHQIRLGQIGQQTRQRGLPQLGQTRENLLKLGRRWNVAGQLKNVIPVGEDRAIRGLDGERRHLGRHRAWRASRLKKGHGAGGIAETPQSRGEVLVAGNVFGLLGGVQSVLVEQSPIGNRNRFYGAFFKRADRVRKDRRRCKAAAGQQQRQYCESFAIYCAPQHFLYFFPLPQGQGSLRPAFCLAITGALAGEASPPRNCSAAISFSLLRWMLRVRSRIEFWAAWRCASLMAG